jgi:hypothetical protein
LEESEAREEKERKDSIVVEEEEDDPIYGYAARAVQRKFRRILRTGCGL